MSNHEMPPQAIVDPGLAIVTTGNLRGMIIHSQRDKRIRVIWPRSTTGHYYATPGKDNLDTAENMILDAFRGRQ